MGFFDFSDVISQPSVVRLLMVAVLIRHLLFTHYQTTRQSMEVSVIGDSVPMLIPDMELESCLKDPVWL